MKTPTGFEKAFVSEWSGWDEADYLAVQFYDAKLAINVGPFKAGDTVNCIGFNLNTNTVQIHNAEGNLQYEGTIEVVLLDDLEDLRATVDRLAKQIFKLETGKVSYR